MRRIRIIAAVIICLSFSVRADVWVSHLRTTAFTNGLASASTNLTFNSGDKYVVLEVTLSCSAPDSRLLENLGTLRVDSTRPNNESPSSDDGERSKWWDSSTDPAKHENAMFRVHLLSSKGVDPWKIGFKFIGIGIREADSKTSSIKDNDLLWSSTATPTPVSILLHTRQIRQWRLLDREFINIATTNYTGILAFNTTKDVAYGFRNDGSKHTAAFEFAVEVEPLHGASTAIIRSTTEQNKMPDSGAGMRIWHSSKGDSIKAQFKEEYLGWITLEKADGNIVRVHVSKLSKEDRDYLKKLRL